MPGRHCSACTRGGEGWLGAALTHVNELLLLRLGHLAETVVAACQVPGEAIQCVHSHFLHLSALGAGAGWRQAQATDAAPSPDPGREHIALIKLAKLYLEWTEATGCLWGGPGAGRALPPRPKEGHSRAAPLSSFCTFVASRSVGCFMVRGLYPLCRS